MDASILKPSPHSASNQLTRRVQEFRAASSGEPFSPHETQNRAAQHPPARAASTDEPAGPPAVFWLLQSNATLPPDDDEYADFEQHLYALGKVNRNREAIALPENGDETWTEAKNQRRCDLIDRKYAGSLTPAETVELARLQEQMLRHRQRVAPLPLEDARRLHHELLTRASVSQSPTDT